VLFRSGLLHVSDMSWTKKVNHPSEMLKKSEVIDCVVLNVDQERQRIALGLKQLHEDPWAHAVIDNYIPGQIVEGTVTKITNFGVFVELEKDLEGLLHVSELADHKVEDPHSEVKIADKILVKILRVDPAERKIGLSKKRAEWSVEQDADSGIESKPRIRRGGLEGPGEDTTSLIQPPPFTPPRPAEKVRADAEEPTKEEEARQVAEAGTPETSGDTGEGSDIEGSAEAGIAPVDDESSTTPGDA